MLRFIMSLTDMQLNTGEYVSQQFTPTLLHDPIGTQEVFVIDYASIWGYIYIELTYRNDVIIPIYLFPPHQVPMLGVFMVSALFSSCFHKIQPVRFTGGFLEGESFITIFYIRCQRVSEVGYVFCWRHLFFFILDQIRQTNICSLEYELVGRYVHRLKEVNYTK